jgi:hypothetical protein
MEKVDLEVVKTYRYSEQSETWMVAVILKSEHAYVDAHEWNVDLGGHMASVKSMRYVG